MQGGAGLRALLRTLSPPARSEGWEQNGLYEFFRAKMRARRRKGQEKRNRRVGLGGAGGRVRAGPGHPISCRLHLFPQWPIPLQEQVQEPRPLFLPLQLTLLQVLGLLLALPIPLLLPLLLAL